MEAFRAQNTQNRFTAAGLEPANPERVLSKLNIQLETLTSTFPAPQIPGEAAQEAKASLPKKTSRNLVELHRQASTISQNPYLVQPT